MPKLASSALVDRLTLAFLIGLFAFAAVDKLLHVPGFIKAIDNYRMLPFPMGAWLAPLVIAAELTVAVGLLRRSWRQSSAMAGAVMMAIFTVGLIGNRMSGEDAICGCWFSISMAQGDAHFFLNGIVILMCVATAFREAGAPPLGAARLA